MTAPMTATPAVADNHLATRRPVDAALTLSVLRRGRGDPTYRVVGGDLWRTSRLPTGPVSFRIRQSGSGEIACQAWGFGAEELIDGLPGMLGRDDDPGDFRPGTALLTESPPASSRLAHSSGPSLVMESLIPGILEQKVVGLDAFAAWRRLITKFGDPAPGPVPRGMFVFPEIRVWQRIPSWEWHLAGVDPQRSRAAHLSLDHAAKLEKAGARSTEQTYRLLTAMPGIGAWTAAQVGARALGDPDALPVGDYHLPALTSHAIAGRTVGHDEVEACWEPWRPHRWRAVRLLELSGAMPPRHGPRMSRVDHRRI